MIKPIFNNLLSANEFYTLCKNILNALHTSSIDEAIKTQLIERINTYFARLEEAIHRDMKNPLTQELERIDELRDDLFLGFRGTADALLHHWQPEKRDAAQVLIDVIRRHGWTLHRKGYSKQSAAIHSLLTECNTDAVSTSVSTLAISEWLEQLYNTQNAFETTLQQREELDALAKPIVTESRKQVYNDLSSVLKYLDSMAEFSANAELTQLIEVINEIIANVTTSAKARKTRRVANVQSDD